MSDGVSYTLIAGAVSVLVLAGVWRLVRRFEAEQRRRGRWDERGPLYPTVGPPGAGQRGDMNERLEVTGQWVPRPDPRDDVPPRRRASG